MEHDPDCQSGIEDRADNRLVVHDAALAVGSCQTFRCPLHRSLARRCRHDPSSGRGTEGRELQRGAFPPESSGSIFPVKTIRMVGIGLRLPDHEFRTRSLDPAVFVDRVRCWYEVVIGTAQGRRIVLRDEGLRGDDARTTSGAIGRWRELEGKGAREPVAVREFRIAKRQPRPMLTDP